MSSSPRIKNYGAVAWLIDNCGFSVSASSVDSLHVLNLENVEKDGLVFNDAEHSIEFHSTQHNLPMTSTIHFELYGILGLKVYDTLKILASNYEAKHFFHFAYYIPDIDPRVFTNDFRRECASNLLHFLLHRDHPAFDFSQREQLLDFFFSCLQLCFQYTTSYIATLDVDWPLLKETVMAQKQDRSLEVKKQYVAYLYHKKQYLKAKKEEKVSVRINVQDTNSTDLFNPSTLYLHKSHDMASLKRMYKIAKHCYLREKESVSDIQTACLGQLFEIPVIRNLIEWTGSGVIRSWFQENNWNIDHLLLGL